MRAVRYNTNGVNQIMTSIQSKLDELASRNDNRTSVFDIQIQGTQNGSLTLSGRLLDESQWKFSRITSRA